MRYITMVLSTAMVLLSPATGTSADDDGGFHSLAEYLLVEGPYFMPVLRENIDDIFDTRDLAKKLASQKRVQLLRTDTRADELIMAYYDLSRKPPLTGRLGKELPTVEIRETAFRPVLDLASDFNNFGPETMCSFHADVALLIGKDEPEYILICCFTCHDIHIIRRPTKEHPMPQVAEAGMSPELERAVFDLAKASYPNDDTLQGLKLAERKRSKTPLKNSWSTPPADPFAPPPEAKK